jgi:hypothetical protein
MSDDEYAVDPDTVVLDYIACSVHSDPAFKAQARAAWEQALAQLRRRLLRLGGGAAC